LLFALTIAGSLLLSFLAYRGTFIAGSFASSLERALRR
jgi:hypothetical protein